MIYFLQRFYGKNFFLLIGFLFTASAVSYGQITFSAIANETRIADNEYVQVHFKIENAKLVRRIEPPSFEDFEIVSGPNHESGSITINSNRKNYVAVSFILKPLKTGKLSLEPATAFADGQTIQSNPLTIEVSKAVGKRAPQRKAAPAPFSGFGVEERSRRKRPNHTYTLRTGEDATEKIKKNLLVRLVADKTECYVGEPIVVSFKLYTRLLSRTTITDAPSFNGFSVTEMDVNENATEEKLNGKTFNTYTLRKVQLFPMREGTYSISPLHSANTVNFVKLDKHERNEAADDPFLSLLQDIGAQSLTSGGMIEKKISLTSNTLTIKAKPLPEKNKPKNFKGAVGNFTVQCSMDNERMTTDDAGNLTVTVSGSGNLAFINTPDINWPSGINAYDATVKEQIDNQQIPVYGSKTFSIPFTVSRAGEYSLPPVHFSWFDPKSGTYDSTVTEPIAFHVSQSNKSLIADRGSASHGGALTISNMEWAGGIALVSGLTVLLLFVFFRKKNKEKHLESQVRLSDIKAEQEAKEFVIPGNPLEAAHEKLNEGTAYEFYRTLEVCLKKYLSAKLHIAPHELTSEKVLEEMDKCNVGIGTTKLFESLVKEVELGLYAKSSHPGQTRYLYEKSSELIALLDKQICE